MLESDGSCGACGHKHAGKQLAYICIGCPCEARFTVPHAGLAALKGEEVEWHECPNADGGPVILYTARVGDAFMDVYLSEDNAFAASISQRQWRCMAEFTSLAAAKAAAIVMARLLAGIK